MVRVISSALPNLSPSRDHSRPTRAYSKTFLPDWGYKAKEEDEPQTMAMVQGGTLSCLLDPPSFGLTIHLALCLQGGSPELLPAARNLERPQKERDQPCCSRTRLRKVLLPRSLWSPRVLTLINLWYRSLSHLGLQNEGSLPLSLVLHASMVLRVNSFLVFSLQSASDEELSRRYTLAFLGTLNLSRFHRPAGSGREEHHGGEVLRPEDPQKARLP